MVPLIDAAWLCGGLGIGGEAGVLQGQHGTPLAQLLFHSVSGAGGEGADSC